MINKTRTAMIISIAALLIVTAGCLSESEDADYEETLTQVSTIDAVLNGDYDGMISYNDLEKYGDFGIGTFEGLDGEMVALEGDFFQVRADGIATEVNPDTTTPFAVLTYFEADQRTALETGVNYQNVQATIDNLIPTENIFFAIKINGTFSYMKTRSVPKQTKPYPPLVEVTANQPIFEFTDIEGTLVGFRSPPYVTGINMPGYHLHFITSDRTAGGHVLEFEVANAELLLDHTSEFFMLLPGEGSDFYKLDLSKDKEEELEQAEK